MVNKRQKKQQRHVDEKKIAEDIIRQSELVQVVWEMFSKEEEQSHT